MGNDVALEENMDGEDELEDELNDGDEFYRASTCRIKPKCAALGGYCVRGKRDCNGKINKKLCNGLKCSCCIPNCLLTGQPGVACNAPTSCEGYGPNLNGVYDICPLSNCPPVQVQCMCDGWTVILYRNISLLQTCNFTQDWNGYKQGFCDASGELWLGNDILNALTGSSPYQMELYGITPSGVSRTMVYSSFSVANETDDYRLAVTGFNAAASSALDQFEAPFNQNIFLNGMKFTTYDRDNDFRDNLNCAFYCEGGGWWFNSCTGLLLTRTNTLYWFYWDSSTFGPIEVAEVYMRIKP